MTDLKDSGVYWLGEVASDFDIVPSTIIFRERSEKNLKDDIHLTPSQKYGVLPQDKYQEITGGKVMQKLSDSDMKHVEPNDFVIHLRSFQGGIERSQIRGKVSTAYTVLEPRDGVFTGYWRYFLKSAPFIEGMASSTDQLRDGQTINYARFSRLKLLRPPLETQRRIADYLDKEISEMDTLIEEFDGLATNLTNRRSLLITKKLYDHLNGCERSVVGLWNYASTNPLTPEFRDLPEGEKIDFLPLENVWSHGKADYSEKIAWDGGKSSYTQFRRGDILVPKVTPTVFHGRTMVAETESPIGLATSEVHTLRAHLNADPRWIVYNMLSSKFLDEARGQIYGVAGLQRISTQYLSTFKVPLTPLEKQVEIADELDREFERMDTLIEESTRLIENLKARKTALITEVVTGRKEV
ncbi:MULTISPECIES: restriction endonuclease subunit S [Corynebacterium]|uniref:restriction endonuclease subunit S n=1 Tax=Corynebacterium TaxID=1716 RepID=UPI0008A5D1FE|nr:MULTISPECIES: restriction endonuclease subunit S [Corynebacterium]MDK8726108.1 restriction endonuclease subunit S [Corynebacterium amycolatum]OFL10182.1 hypothetical protein HMPREF2788_06560 [Corynebacterium sp. HMSC063F04]OFN38917.1 hypothetical protein HMPREF2562_07850 [Corynebacterium sp. HMSC077G07]